MRRPGKAAPSEGGASLWGGASAGVEPGGWLLRSGSPVGAAAEAGLQERRAHALHLRRYNDALLIHDTVRAVDALATLRQFYDWERATKTQVLRAERWLLALFDGEAPGDQGVGTGLAVSGQLGPGLGSSKLGRCRQEFWGPRFPKVKAVDRTKEGCAHL